MKIIDGDDWLGRLPGPAQATMFVLALLAALLAAGWADAAR